MPKKNNEEERVLKQLDQRKAAEVLVVLFNIVLGMALPYYAGNQWQLFGLIPLF